jgi:hypothetical protein
VHLQRAFEPLTERRHERGRSLAGVLRELVEQRVEARRVVLGCDTTSKKNRQRDESELDDVGVSVEMHLAVESGDRDDAEIPPQLIGRQPQLIERRADDVFDDDDAAVGRDDDPFRRQRAVGDAAAVRVEIRHCGRQLTNQPRDERRVHAGARMTALEHFIEPLARRVRRHQRQAIVAIEIFDGARLAE